ncbi:MAG: hypothetical protein WB699_16965, partial [Bacteroidota bacterium]
FVYHRPSLWYHDARPPSLMYSWGYLPFLLRAGSAPDYPFVDGLSCGTPHRAHRHSHFEIIRLVIPSAGSNS